jgi:asparagine synthase (glutamine-hydrolysing)
MIKKELYLNPYQHQLTAYDFDFTKIDDSLSIPLVIDYLMYLQNDILTKVDRATMSVSLEGREPFLDHRIIEFTARFPMEFKNGSIQKMILKDIVYKYVPKLLMDRPKAGFSVPIYSWLKKDMYFLLAEFLDPPKIKESGLFQPLFVQKLKQDFIKGHLKDPTIIWKLLQFQMWYSKWIH